MPSSSTLMDVLLRRRHGRQLRECIVQGDAQRLARSLAAPRRRRALLTAATARELLHLAASRPWHGHEPSSCFAPNRCVEELLNCGVHVDVHDIHGNTALSVTCSLDHGLSTLCGLLAKGADINCENKRGETPLHVAAKNGLVHTVETLLCAGAEITQTRRGLFPMDLAIRNDHMDVAEMLLTIEAGLGHRHWYALVTNLREKFGSTSLLENLIFRVTAPNVSLNTTLPEKDQRRSVAAVLYASRGCRYVSVARDAHGRWPFVLSGCADNAMPPRLELLPASRQCFTDIAWTGDVVLCVNDTVVATRTHSELTALLDKAASSVKLLVVGPNTAHFASFVSLATCRRCDHVPQLFRDALRDHFMTISAHRHAVSGARRNRIDRTVIVSRNDHSRLLDRNLCVNLHTLAASGNSGYPRVAVLLPGTTINQLIAAGVSCARDLLAMRIDQLQGAISSLYKQQQAASRQFDLLCKQPPAPHPCEVSKQHEGMNRFEDVWAYDHSRVILDMDEKGYINANFVRDVNGRVRWIAAQAPLPSTFDRFWWMVWQEQVPLIIMLTRSSPVSEMYWGNKDKWLAASEIHVRVEEETPLSCGIVHRKLCVLNTLSGERRRVHQLCFQRWADDAPPKEVVGVLLLRSFATRLCSRQAQDGIRGPVVVHCNAGVGRTGTYIAIDSILTAVESNLCVPRRLKSLDRETDVLSVVSALRNDRMQLVQTAEQYASVFLAVLEALTRLRQGLLREHRQLQSVGTLQDQCHDRVMGILSERLRAAQQAANAQRSQEQVFTEHGGTSDQHRQEEEQQLLALNEGSTHTPPLLMQHTRMASHPALPPPPQQHQHHHQQQQQQGRQWCVVQPQRAEEYVAMDQLEPPVYNRTPTTPYTHNGQYQRMAELKSTGSLTAGCDQVPVCDVNFDAAGPGTQSLLPTAVSAFGRASGEDKDMDCRRFHQEGGVSDGVGGSSASVGGTLLTQPTPIDFEALQRALRIHEGEQQQQQQPEAGPERCVFAHQDPPQHQQEWQNKPIHPPQQQQQQQRMEAHTSLLSASISTPSSSVV